MQGKEKGKDTVFLDQLHALAKDAGIVSPTSSLLALVNDQQRQELERQSQQANRYETQDQVVFQRGTPGAGLGPFSGGIISNPFGVNFESMSLPNSSRGVTGGGGVGLASPMMNSSSFGSSPSTASPIGLFILITVIVFMIGASKSTIQRLKKKK
jgi:hypothetical protein